MWLLMSLLFGAGIAAAVYVIYKTVAYLTSEIIRNLMNDSNKELYDANKITDMSGWIIGEITSREGTITKISLKKNAQTVGELQIDAKDTDSDIYVGKKIEVYNY